MADLILQESLGDLVAKQLRRRIWDKELEFGERLIESDLSEQFEVSRSTIRDALKILEHEELIVSKPRKGTYVATFSKEDWREIIEIRSIVESYAFVKALPNLTKKDFLYLENIILEMKATVKTENWSKLFDLDMQFHSYVIRLSENKRVIKLYDSLQTQIRTFFIYLDNYYSSFESFYNDQKELYDALLSKDPEIVEETIRTHIEYVEGKVIALE